MPETKTVWVAYTNTDLTEGRGRQVPLHICEMKVTAERLGKNGYVMGTQCPVEPMELVKLEGKWYAPRAAIEVIQPSAADIAAQQLLDAREAVLAKAKAAGLSDEDIKTLRSMKG